MSLPGSSVLYLLCSPAHKCIYRINGSSFVAFCTLSCHWTLSSPFYLFSISTVSPFLLFSLPLMEAKRSQSISNCVHLCEAIPTTKSVPMLLHTVSSFLPGISSGNSACSHRLSGKVHCESCMCMCVCVCVSSFTCHCLSLFASLSVCLLWLFLAVDKCFNTSYNCLLKCNCV